MLLSTTIGDLVNSSLSNIKNLNNKTKFVVFLISLNFFTLIHDIVDHMDIDLFGFNF